MLQHQQARRRRDQGHQQPLLVAAGERFDQAVRPAHHPVARDPLLRQPFPALAVDPPALPGIGEDEMLGQSQAGNQPFLQATRRAEAHPCRQKVTVRAAGHVHAIDEDTSSQGTIQTDTGARQQLLAAAVKPGQPDHLPGPHAELAAAHDHPLAGHEQIAHLQNYVAQRHFGPGGRGQLLAKHHGHQVAGGDGQDCRPDQAAQAQHGHFVAQLQHIFQLMGNEQDGQAIFAGQPLQGSEQDALLLGGDAGGRLVQDQHSHAQRQQADDLQLLPLADAQALDQRIQLQAEAQPPGQLGEAPPGGVPVRQRADRLPVDEVLQHGQRPDVKRVLSQHPDADLDRPARGVVVHRPAVDQHLPAIGQVETRQDLH